MSTLSYAMRDSATMLRRDIRHSLRYPMMTLSGVLVPIFFLLLFVGVLGNTLRAGLGAASPAGGHYVDYLVPGVILLTVGGSAEATAVAICTDMKEGIIARFRTMGIARTSVLTGQVLGSLIQALISVALVMAAMLVGPFVGEIVKARKIPAPDVAHAEQQSVYSRYYSLSRLRERCERHFAGDREGDLWQGLLATFRLFRDDRLARELGLTALGGELFGEAACRDLEDKRG